MFGDQCDRIVQIRERKDDNATQVLLGFGERAIGDDYLAPISPQPSVIPDHLNP
jgi:hypothetical protein